MPAVAHSIRVPEALEQEIKRELDRRGIREWSAGVLAMIDEAIRMSRAPGIIFRTAWNGERRAAVAFGGMEVWEIIRFWNARGQNWDVFRREFEDFTEAQLRAALNYYALYPEEIDARLAREEYWTEERLARDLPFTQPNFTSREP